MVRMKPQVKLPYTLKRRLAFSFILIIVLMALLNVTSLYWSGTYYGRLSSRLHQHVGIHTVSMECHKIPDTIGNYISSGNRNYIVQSYQHLDTIQEQLVRLQNNTLYRSPLYFYFTDSLNMVATLRSLIDELVVNYVSEQPIIYIRNQENTILRHIGYIQSELSKINSTYMEEIQDFYRGFAVAIARVVRITIGMTVILVILFSMIAHRFTLSITQPIHTLALTMLKFGKGDLSASIEPRKTNDEISVLITSFNRMSQQIQRLVLGIRKKAEVEKQLKNQELANQEAHRLLKESELALLQSQINPHFLFNTLNTISAVAQIEEAPETDKLIVNLSTMLRYNLKNQSDTVPLAKEVEVVKSYMHIQMTRYGHKLTYTEKIDPSTLGALVPIMLLQPLVENAIKHGIEPLGRKGQVVLTIEKTLDDKLRIIIEDDGKGIDDKILENLYSQRTAEEEKPLGIYNVARRLQLYYGNQPLSIKKGAVRGTVCMIQIPNSKKEDITESSADIPLG